jgi:hypothetical protein
VADAKRGNVGAAAKTASAPSKLRKDGAGPAVPALVPTAEVGADDDEVDDIIEGEGVCSSLAVLCTLSCSLARCSGALTC